MPGGYTSVAGALERSYPLLKRKGSLVVISDFFDEPEAIFAALSPYLHRGFKVHLINVLTPQELNLPEKGLVRFVDMESAERVIAHTRHIREKYNNAIRQHLANLRPMAARRQVDYAVARTDRHHFNLFDRFTQ